MGAFHKELQIEHIRQPWAKYNTIKKYVLTGNYKRELTVGI
jgi:hypothetical protein